MKYIYIIFILILILGIGEVHAYDDDIKPTKESIDSLKLLNKGENNAANN